MTSKKSSFNDEVFEDDDDLEADLEDDESLDFDEASTTTKRRLIEDLLEERRLYKEIEDDYDFDLEDD